MHRQARCFYKQGLLDQAIVFINSTSWDVPRTRKWIAFQIFKVIASSSGVTDDLVWALPSRPQLPLCWIPSSLWNFPQHHVIGVEPSKLYPLIIVLLHFLLIPSHSQGYLISNFNQTIQTEPQFVIVCTFVVMSSPKIGNSYLGWNNCFSAEGQLKWSFSFWCSCCCPVIP